LLNLTDKNNPIINGDYEAGRDDNERFYAAGITGRQRKYRIGQDLYNEKTRRHHNYWNNYKKKQTTHTFYENRIHECPFCGHEEAQPDKHNWEDRCPIRWFSRTWGLQGNPAEMTKEYLHSNPIKYRRCEGCQDMSHKKHLADYKPRYGNIDKPKKEIYDAIYPSPMEHDRDYFLDKRERKRQSKMQANNDLEVCIDVNCYDIESSYSYAGNVYLMYNNHTGRIKIGMTQNEPKFRESTLQSEDPDVELAFSRSVLMMRDTERYLHERFADKRYRGEWFDLSTGEIEEAKSLIKRATHKIL